MLDLLCYLRNPLTSVVDGTIFQKIFKTTQLERKTLEEGITFTWILQLWHYN